MTAEAYLEQIKKIDAVIVNKLNDHKKWVELAEGMGGFSVGERVQASRNLHQIPNAIGRYIDIEREIEALKQKRQDIIETLQELPYNEYKLLYKVFVEDYILKELPDHFCKSYEWVKKTKRLALEHLQEILDKKRG